ncbi:MAG TPA: ATP-binding protein [Gemmatimonadales bacterium]|nr:ATP-binding protein [Gemmatimonadales bacterium]
MTPTLRARRSLGIRLLLPLALTVGIVFAVHSLVNYRSTRADLVGFLRSAADNDSDLIRRATHDGMLLNRLDEVQELITRLAAGPGVAAIRVYDKHGVIVLSAHREEIGRYIALDSETCLSCHQQAHTSDVGELEQSGLARAPEGVEVLRHLAVIPNEPSCATAGCHDPPGQKRILGVLDVEMSMLPVESTLRAAQQRIIATTLALILIIGVVSVVFFNRVVHRPVAALHEGTRRIAAGDLKTRISVRGQHELSELAHAFNRMSEDLSTAQQELKGWSQKLEAKVQEKTSELQRAQRQVLHMEKMASLGKLSATVAHELNNPISGMLNYSRLVERGLEDQPLDPDAREELGRYLHFLQKECSRCGKIVTNLLLFARRTGADMEPIDLNEIVERSLMLVQHHLRVSNIELSTRPLTGNAMIVADGGQLQQALVALMVNAVEAMGGSSNGGGVLSVRLDASDGEITLEIADTGPGIAPEVLPHIFEPFFSTKDQESGVGLGLAVVYGIVQRHGGTIDVDSEPGLGTKFTMRLPRQRPPDASGFSAANPEFELHPAGGTTRPEGDDPHEHA